MNLMPKAGTLYDLFAGGMAVTHAALMGNKYKRVVANDIIGDMGELFENAMNGVYRGEERWISREDFRMYKDGDPYIKYIWSFGNNGMDYMYSKEEEPIKRAQHRVCFAKTPYERKLALGALGKALKNVEDEKMRLRAYIIGLCDECGVDCVRRPDGTLDTKALNKTLTKYVQREVLEYMREALRASGKTQADVDKFMGNQMSRHWFGASQFSLPTEAQYEKLREILPGLTKPWGGLKERLESLQRYVGDYRDVEIEDDSVIYCDIPYRGTDGYGSEFDHEAFYDWCERQRVPVFISEYWMPEKRFVCVAEFGHVSSFSNSGNKKVLERVFCPRSNNRAVVQGVLF